MSIQLSSLTTYFPAFVHNVPLQSENGDIKIEDQQEHVVEDLIHEAHHSYAWAQDPTLRQFIKQACERVRNSMPHEVASLECYTTQTGLFTSKLRGNQNTRCFYETMCAWTRVFCEKREKFAEDEALLRNQEEYSRKMRKIDNALGVISHFQQGLCGNRFFVVAYDVMGRLHGAARILKTNEKRHIEWLVTSPYDLFPDIAGHPQHGRPVRGVGASLICHVVPKKKFKEVTVNSFMEAQTFYSHLGFSRITNTAYYSFYLSEEGRTQILNKYLAASHRIKYMDREVLVH